MKVLGIGNAIVDVICKVNDDFITQNNLIKVYLWSEVNFYKMIWGIFDEAAGAFSGGFEGLERFWH